MASTQLKAFLICLALCVQTTQAYWSFSLQHQVIREIKDETEGVVLDDAHYRLVNFITESNEHPYNTTLDTTTRYNWATTKTCVSEMQDDACPTENLLNCDSEPCTGKSTNSEIQETNILGGRGNLKQADEGDDNIKIAGDTFVDVPLIFPGHISAKECEYEVQDAVGRAGLGLGYTNSPDYPNFLTIVKNSLKDIQNQKFSFYFDGQIDQVLFGEPEDYFRIEEFIGYNNVATGEAFNTIATNVQNQWKLKVKSLTLGNAIDISFQNSGKKETFAVLDSTTKYIWTPSQAENDDKQQDNSQNDIMDEIMEKLNINHGAQCAKDPTDNLYHCICTKQFMSINFGFGDKDDNDKTYSLQMEDYVEFHDKDSNQKNCNLLFRPARTFRIQGSSNNAETSFLPQESYKERFFYLGTSFMRTIYTVFDQDNNKIFLAHSFNVQPSALKVSEATRITAIVMSLFIILISLGILLSILKKVPLQQLATVQTITTSLPYVIQTPVVPAQQIITSSPVRFAPAYQQQTQYLK